MRDVVIALIPALIASVVIFGIRALILVAVCVVCAVLSEAIFEKAVGREVTIRDYSAVVTGLLLAFNLPVGISPWIAAFGSVVAIVMVKQMFGGIGHNFANPAITARIILMVSFATPMTTWEIPKLVDGGIDLVAGATPLAQISAGNVQELPSLTQMLLGVRGGCLGETCAIALLIGGAYLLYRRVITLEIPVAFIGTVFVMTLLLGKEPVYQVLSGGLLLGAFFMATDYSTSPATRNGKIIFGIGCGLITVLIRVFGNYPEGVSFSILLMNILAPHISNLTANQAFGGAKKA